jgi:hypothetical protein
MRTIPHAASERSERKLIAKKGHSFSGDAKAVTPRFSRALDGHRVSSADMLMRERRLFD